MHEQDIIGTQRNYNREKMSLLKKYVSFNTKRPYVVQRTRIGSYHPSAHTEQCSHFLQNSKVQDLCHQCEQGRIWPDVADEQNDINLRRSQSLKVCFHVQRLIGSHLQKCFAYLFTLNYKMSNLFLKSYCVSMVALYKCYTCSD